ALPLDQRWIHQLLDSLKQDLADTTGPALTLMEFVEQAWPIVEPDHAFVANWHIGAIADHLQGITAGHLSNLIITIPPGCMKSRLVSVLWPAWEWTQRPSLRYLCASYDQSLSTRDNVAVRELVTSAWYRERWRHVALS